MERTHLTVKAVADTVKNLTRFEKSVLSGVLNLHWRSLERLRERSGLKGAVAKIPGSANLYVADHMELDAMRISSGDVVCRQDLSAGQVIACVADAIDNEMYAIVDLLELKAPLSSTSSSYSLATGRAVWPVADLRVALAWYADHGSIVVIRM